MFSVFPSIKMEKQKRIGGSTKNTETWGTENLREQKRNG